LSKGSEFDSKMTGKEKPPMAMKTDKRENASSSRVRPPLTPRGGRDCRKKKRGVGGERFQ